MDTALLGALCLSALMTAASAGTAADPTTPAAKWLAAQPAAAAGAPAPKPQPMETQLILFSAERKIAVVDGRIVRLGETYNGERLVAMKRNEVQWKPAERPATEDRPAIVKKSLMTEGTK